MLCYYRYIVYTFLAALLLGSSACEESGDKPDESAYIPGATADTVAKMDTATNIDTLLMDSVSVSIPSSLPLVSNHIQLGSVNHLLKEKEFTLDLAEGFGIAVAADSMKRLRFMAFSPDNRLFVADMYGLSDNNKGKVYILEDFDTATMRFEKRTTYLQSLRNPNSIAFHVDRNGQNWFYIAMTDRLVRYRYTPGDNAPSGGPDTLATFPDSGRGYREGGWHLTRTVTFGENGKLYVSVGSSCNICEEKEKVRATILEMNPDGSERRIYASGLRNAVGIRWVNGWLWATNMGADHLGLNEPEDAFYRIDSGANYGWPYVYEYRGAIHPDPVYGSQPKAPPVSTVPVAWAGLPAHVAPLGFDWFNDASETMLKNSFLVALHGSGAVAMKRGYSIVRITEQRKIAEFVSGFLKGKKRYGRPCDILRAGPDAFFFTDDYAGVVYYVYKVDPDA